MPLEVQRRFPPEADDCREPGAIRGAHPARAGQVEAIEGEVGASDERFEGAAVNRFGLGGDRIDRPPGEVGHFEGFGDVERPGMAVGAEASPVVDPEGGVGHLLNLGQQDPRADRVDGPGGNVDHVPRLRLEGMQHIGDPAGVEGPGESVAVDP